MYEIILTHEWEYNVLSFILTQEGLLEFMKIKSYFYDQQINNKKLGPSIETITGNP